MLSSSGGSSGGRGGGPSTGGEEEGGGEGGRGYDLFVNAQLGLILLLPFAVHVALGGLERSGGVMLWSFLSPVGAAFFRSTSEGLRWFVLYMCINVVLLTGTFWDAEGGGYHYGTMTRVAVGEDDYDGVGMTGGTTDVVHVDAGEYSSSETIRKLYWLMNIIGVKCVVFAAVYLFARELETEYAKSEEMLLNILPRSIVKRIKRGEFPIVDHVSNVTILFADLGEWYFCMVNISRRIESYFMRLQRHACHRSRTSRPPQPHAWIQSRTIFFFSKSGIHEGVDGNASQLPNWAIPARYIPGL
jgi:hypothetical protein